MVLQSCVLFWSLMNGINPNVTQAIVFVESGGNPYAISRDGKDFGLMQIRKKFSKYTKHQLLSPCTNIMAATEILSKAKKYCINCKNFEYVNLYNVGRVGGNKIKNHGKFKYYKKVVAEINRNN